MRRDGRSARREPSLDARRAAEKAVRPSEPALPAQRPRLSDYAPFAQDVRPVLTPMRRPQVIAEPSLASPFLISAALHAGLLLLMLWPHRSFHGSSEATDQPQVEMVFDAPPSRSGMTGPRSRDQGGAPPPSSSASSAASAPMPAVPTPQTPSSPPVEESPSGELAKSAPSSQPVMPATAPRQKPSQKTSAHPQHHSAKETKNNPFAHPMDLSFGESPSPRPHRRGRRAGSGGPIDLSLGPLSLHGAINAPYQTRNSVKGVSSDYGAEIDRWIRTHMYYPEEAARAGEDGPSSVHVVIDRFGHVRTVRLTGQSGSYSLDAATTGMFQGARLPPVPPDMVGDHFDLDVTINYILIRR